MKQKKKEIIIANPIYDAVFKSLMMKDNGTNKNNARFFVGTILGEEVVDITLLSQEYPYHTRLKKEHPKSEEVDLLTLIRLDFVATIHTKSGEFKKVIIEIQKSKKKSDLTRFCTYLCEQYKLSEKIEIDDKQSEETMPIVVIYMLGFKLPEIEAIGVKVDRTYVDMLYGGKINSKSPFIESLTHDGYFMQIPRITAKTFEDWGNCSVMEQMLSLFEQNYFIENNFYKRYPYPITNKNMEHMIETLEYIVADPYTKRCMQEEYWAELDVTLWENQVETLNHEKMAQANQIETLIHANMAKDNQIAAQSNQLAHMRKLLEQAGIELPDDEG